MRRRRQNIIESKSKGMCGNGVGGTTGTHYNDYIFLNLDKCGGHALQTEMKNGAYLYLK